MDETIIRFRVVNGNRAKVQSKQYPNVETAAAMLMNCSGNTMGAVDCLKGILAAIESGDVFPGGTPRLNYTWDYLLTETTKEMRK